METNPCCNCFTIEGESELSIAESQDYQDQLAILHLYTGAMTWDPAVEQYSAQKDQCSTNHIWGFTVEIKKPSTMQLHITYTIFTQ